MAKQDQCFKIIRRVNAPHILSRRLFPLLVVSGNKMTRNKPSHECPTETNQINLVSHEQAESFAVVGARGRIELPTQGFRITRYLDTKALV